VGQVLRRMRCSGACSGRVGAAWLLTGAILNARVRPRRVRANHSVVGTPAHDRPEQRLGRLAGGIPPVSVGRTRRRNPRKIAYDARTNPLLLFGRTRPLIQLPVAKLTGSLAGPRPFQKP